MTDLVFVYGTLTDDAQVAALLDSYRFVGDAVCVGFKRVDGRYPTLVPGESVTGRLLETDEIDRLDRYEGVDRGLYHRVSVSLTSSLTSSLASSSASLSATTAEVYLAAPTAIGLGSLDEYWPGEGSFLDRVDRQLPATHIERVS
ncbi:gamma-glutamylcyclotransferase family protein [Halonotius roseus]|uniref:Gamma-glutamylcyclotransferase n=1 Tax=Halonotius roseus TaxID=2511997 RepID=A0A544QP73_9EURY|nr:gamma-glutamylcyclotransferase family protein [Halonotius roseus]TQQ80711.1 gamma-glutamylcyclotransferase [Halonotius roseus]